MNDGYVITIPKTSEGTENGKNFTIFHITITGGKNRAQQTVERRYHNFRNFDMDWRRVYGGSLGAHFQLPGGDTHAFSVLSSKQALTENRRKALQKYLQDLVVVSCLQPLVLAFCGLDYAGKKTDEMLDINDFDDAKPRGNNQQASEKAMQEKMQFMEKNREILNQLMPGFSNTLSFEATELKRDVLNPNQRNPTAANRALAATLSGLFGLKKSADPTSMPFQRRFCVLTGCQIGFYGHENDTVPVGTIVLNKSSIVKREAAEKEAKFVFSVTPLVGRMFYFISAPDEGSLENWCSTIERAIANNFGTDDSKANSGKLKVIKSYAPGEGETTCVAVTKGDTVTVTNRDDPAWFFGVSGDKEGYFPSDCLQVPPKAATESINLNTGPFDLAAQVQVMTHGANFLKFAFKSKGKPKKMAVFYRPNADSSSHKGCLFYCEVGQREMSYTRCLVVNQLAEVISGKGTNVFAGKLDYSEHLCFSINYFAPKTNTPRSLDLMADTRQQRDAWVRGLREIIYATGDKAVFRTITIAMAPEKPDSKPAPKLKALPPSTPVKKNIPTGSKQREEDPPALPPRPAMNVASAAAMSAQRRLTINAVLGAQGDTNAARTQIENMAMPHLSNMSSEEEEVRDAKVAKARMGPPNPFAKQASQGEVQDGPKSPAGRKVGPPNPFKTTQSNTEEPEEAPTSPRAPMSPMGPGPASPMRTGGPPPARRGPPPISNSSSSRDVTASPDEPPAVSPRGMPPPARMGRGPPPKGGTFGAGPRPSEGSERCNKCNKPKTAPALKFCPCGGMFA